MLSSELLLIIIFPLSTSTFSSKFNIILDATSTLAALSAGVEELKVGFAVSTVVKLNAVVLDIPA
ncbi:MAG: hypothetical protein CM15mP7_0180 [Pelagibacteraceae bacterium]|nr:MAG: hypothetical protein CM15mP7_0180 [Pelagibacteraceae bacterium]